MRLAVGDVVVYPAHGVGSVVAREERTVLGEPREVVVLDLIDGLSVTLPVDHAQKVLRPLLSEADLRLVEKTLRQTGPLSDAAWLKRKREAQEKMAGGEPLGLAEVVRDGALRERRLRAKGNGSMLSAGERAVYTKARRLLSGEIGLASGIETAQADAWIDEQLGAVA